MRRREVEMSVLPNMWSMSGHGDRAPKRQGLVGQCQSREEVFASSVDPGPGNRRAGQECLLVPTTEVDNLIDDFLGDPLQTEWFHAWCRRSYITLLRRGTGGLSKIDGR